MLALMCVGLMSATTPELVIDPSAANLVTPFEGLGALSAGADAALLFDYPQPQRDRILDLLFTPGFPGGASLQILKVEIPGDVQSTCGSESSHEHFDGDLSFERGYGAAVTPGPCLPPLPPSPSRLDRNSP